VVDGFGGASGMVYLSLTSPMGDVNGDGDIGLEDMVSALQIITASSPGEEIINQEADVNNDLKIGLEETIFLLQQLGE
jgi:hypothetical protein